MEKTKVVTFRIDESELEKIDAIVAKHRYYKRSNVISQALRLMSAMEDAGFGGQALSYHPRFDDIESIEFKIRRKIRP